MFHVNYLQVIKYDFKDKFQGKLTKPIWIAFGDVDKLGNVWNAVKS